MRTLLIVDDNVELASLLAVVAEVHGFAPRVAHTGGEALEHIARQVPEAALVDLLLPDMAGQDLLKVLKEKGVVTFAMSGVFRGEHFAKAAIETYGARAYFEKPFAARDAMVGLVALVSALPSEGAAPAEPPPPPPEQESLDAGDAVFSSEPSPEGPSSANPSPPVPSLESMFTAETTGIFAQPAAPPPLPADAMEPEPAAAPEAPAQVEVEVIVEPAPCIVPPPLPAPEMRVAREVREALAAIPDPPPEPQDEITMPAEAPPVAQAEPLPFSSREVWSSSLVAPPEPAAVDGPVRMAPGIVARLLSGLAHRSATGELRIKRGEVLKVVGLRDGRIVFAASNLGSERLPRFAVRIGKLPNDRAAALQEELKKGGRTQDALVAMGIIDESERFDLVTQLIREIIWSVLDSEGGDVQFVTHAPARKGLLPVALDPITLVLEGYRRSFTLVRLRELVEPGKRYVQVGEWPLDELDLSGGEITLLAAADGSKEIEDLVLLSELQEREALAALVGLAHLGVLEARAPAGRRIVLV